MASAPKSVKTVKEYLAWLPEDRRKAIEAVRKVILKNLPRGFVESMGYGMITYQVPLDVYPDTYNKKPLMYAALGSQKNFMAVYLMCGYGSPRVAAELKAGFEKAGKKMDAGKSCIRFKKVEDLALDAIGKAVGSCKLENFLDVDRKVHPPKKALKTKK